MWKGRIGAHVVARVDKVLEKWLVHSWTKGEIIVSNLLLFTVIIYLVQNIFVFSKYKGNKISPVINIF
jgi:hypothetical protein